MFPNNWNRFQLRSVIEYYWRLKYFKKQEAQATLELVVTDVTAAAQWFIEELAH